LEKDAVRLPIQVLVYAVRQDGAAREYLLLHRDVRRDGFWQGITGGVEDGEALSDAARRELMEETGFVPQRLEQLDFTYTFPLAARWGHLYAQGVREIREHAFVADVTADAMARPPVIDPQEHDAWRWCRLEEAIDLLYWPENAEALRHAEVRARTWFEVRARTWFNEA
jgi:dATP pyrophosphohydrolase